MYLVVANQRLVEHCGILYRQKAAAAVDHIGSGKNWSAYATGLIKRAIQVAESPSVLDDLKILLYPKLLQPKHVAELEKFKRGIV